MSESAEPAEVKDQQEEEKVLNEPEKAVEEQQVAEKVNETKIVENFKEKPDEEMVSLNENDEMEPEKLREATPLVNDTTEELERNENNHQRLGLPSLDLEENDKEEEKVLEESHNTMPLPVGNLSQAIEDEEMPSMVTISSISRIDDSETNIRPEEEKKFVDMEENSTKSSPKKQEDNDDSDSVCVIDVDSNEEDDEEDGRGSSYDDEDESSSYRDDDSEETERQHYNANYYRRNSKGSERMENDENDDEEEEEEDEDEEDDPESPRVIAMNDYSDPDGFDGGSDDLVHRHSNGFTRHQQERSNSLQDLSLINCERPQRRSMNPFSQKAIFQRNQERRPSSQGKFSHVESKVKQYIQDMSEQRRISGEIRKKAKEEARHKQQEMAEIQICRNENVVLTCRTMKDYTEKTLKEAVECYEKNSEYFLPHSVGNGDTMKHEQMDVDPVDVEMYKNEEKLDKMNGAAFNENQNNFIPERKGIHRREEYAQKTVSNGDPGNSVCDLRTLTYDEYMKGSTNKGINEEVIREESVSQEIQEIPENCSNQRETDCGFQIENIVSNYRNTEIEDDEMFNRKTPTAMVNQCTETEYQEDPEMNKLRIELYQRNMQFDNLRDAYQRTMSENLGMKMELENLKKMVTQYQQQKPVLETKAASIQTEVPAPNMPTIDDDNNEPHINRRLTTTSIISAVSSQWSDSTGTAISMEPPPNVTTALNSDESANQTKTLKMRNPLSRAFMTSQRILQTLSNITHGRSKSDKLSRKRSRTPLQETRNEAGTSAQSGNNAEALETGQPTSKKRKAEDNDDLSSPAQPFKIPHTENNRKTSENSEAPVIDLEDNNVNEDNEDVTGDDDVYVKNIDDDVKVFVYPENEAGKEHSFLIQAKEVTSNPKPGVRECGPYLLGNVEVYMTEMNGTINIWGKELTQLNTTQQNEELDISTRSKDLRQGFRWQSTPRIFNNQGSVSTSKKSRVVPRFIHPPQQQHSCDINNTVVDCDSCNGHNHRLSWPSCNHNGLENQHTCCPPTVRIEGTSCGCVHNQDRRISCCGVPKFDDGRRFSMPNVYHQSQSPCCYNSHHNHCRNSPQAEMDRHQPFVRRHSFNPTDDDEESAEEDNAHLSPKLGNSPNENSPHSCSNKLVPPSTGTKKSSSDDCFEAPSTQNESDPLIYQKQTEGVEVGEGRKRKLSGRKVRGLLLDLLKGCGDCRTANPINKTSLHHSASVYQPSTSSQHRQCSPNQPSCPTRANEKCSSCRQRNNKTAEIETQLEFFREEMEKLRTRSDALRDMLDTLRNEENTN